MVKDEDYEESILWGDEPEDMVFTKPCNVVQLDGSLYFYSIYGSQINRMCRGGQMVKIDSPVASNLSVAATTSSPRLHVIGTEYYFMKRLHVVLTLDPSQPKCEFNRHYYPLLPLQNDFHYSVSLCIGSCLFIVIGFRMGEFEGQVRLLGFDQNSSHWEWSTLSQCPVSSGADVHENRQLLQYRDNLLYVSGREVVMVPITKVMSALSTGVDIPSESWVSLRDLPEDEGKLIVFREQLLSVGGLECSWVDDIYWEDHQCTTGNVYVYRHDSAEWFAVACLNQPRFCPALFVANDKLFVVGGQVVSQEERDQFAVERWPVDEVSEDNPEFSHHMEEDYLASLGTLTPRSSSPQGPVQDPRGAIQDPQGVVQDPQGVVQDPQGVVQDPRGAIRDPQGVVQDPQGVVQDPQGVVQDPQGVVQDPQGVVQDPQGVVQDPQGVIQDPQGVVQDPQGVVQDPRGAIQDPRGAIQDPQGVVQDPQGVVQDPQGIVQDPRGVVQDPQGVVQDPQGVVQDPRGAIQDPQGVVQDPQGVVQDPQGVVQDPQGVVHDPQSVVQDPQGVVQDPQGVIQDPQGVVQDPQGVVQDPRGAIQDPQGVVQDPQGVVQDPQGVLQDPQVVVQDPQGIVQDPQGVEEDPEDVIVQDPQGVVQIPEPEVDDL